jgi:putative SOS response-associated peptidase YedK
MASNPAALEERFRAYLSTELAVPTYNAAPSQAQLTILNDHPQAIVRAAWGFVPEWAKGRPDVKPLINARAETVATKPFFRDAFKRKRCLVLADGFYEWKRAGKGKVPYRIVLTTEEPFAFAGIWRTVHDAQGRVHPTFASLTLAEAQALLMPLLAELFMAYEVSPKGNLPSYNTPAGLTAGCVGVTTQSLLRVPVECAPDRLARIWSGGTYTTG